VLRRSLSVVGRLVVRQTQLESRERVRLHGRVGREMEEHLEEREPEVVVTKARRLVVERLLHAEIERARRARAAGPLPS